MVTFSWLLQKSDHKEHKAQITSNWFLEHENELTDIQTPPQSSDLNPTENIWDVVEHYGCAANKYAAIA